MLYVIIDLITVLLLLVLMALTLSGGGWKQPLNRLFAAFAAMAALWLPAIHIGNSLDVPRDVAIASNYVVFGCSFAAALLLAKIVVYISALPRDKKALSVAEWFLWPFAILSFTPLVGMGVEVQGSINGVVFGPLGVAYGVVLGSVVLATIVFIVRGLLYQKGASRRQLKSIGWAAICILPLVMLLSFVLPAVTGVFKFTEFGATPVVVLAVAVYYSVIRHRLFDVRLATMRTVGYALSILAMAVMYMLLAYGLTALLGEIGADGGSGPSPLGVVPAIILALAFQPIKRFFDQLTNKIFYRGDYDRDTFFRELGKILSYDTDLQLLLKQASSYIASNMGVERVFFYITGRGVYHGAGPRKRRLPDEDIATIAKYYKNVHEFPEAIVADSVESEEVKRVLASHQSSVVLPLILQGEAIGYLLLGEHKARGYTVRDIRAMESVANELTIAVRNSLSVEEVRELNETLQRRIDDATKELRTSNQQLQRLDEAKDEFISMASHQLRTPLTSIKGYLDMVLQGDLGRVSATQKAVLSEAFISSERMVTLINDFLNVSRLQTGKFMIERRESDLAEAMKGQLQMLDIVAKQHRLTLKHKIGKDVPLVKVDIDKIRQVMLNMIDNAIFYSKLGTSVQISLLKEGDDIVFRVKDTGIGVPEAEQVGLFGKFFRATNARRKRPDGTGIGLFLAKKVILAHGGEMIFESKEGRGSTFGFRLPIA